jgi:hypothetical protein
MYKVYIGTGFKANGEAIPHAQYAEDIQQLDDAAIHAFGGFSRNRVAGGYLNKAGAYVVEDSAVYEISTTDARAVNAFAALARELFEQESVMVSSVASNETFI